MAAKKPPRRRKRVRSERSESETIRRRVNRYRRKTNYEVVVQRTFAAIERVREKGCKKWEVCNENPRQKLRRRGYRGDVVYSVVEGEGLMKIRISKGRGIKDESITIVEGGTHPISANTPHTLIMGPRGCRYIIGRK